MTIALVMLVKDEADTLPRTLPAARTLIDAWTIVDTGSTDATRDVVREQLAGIPGQLHEREWQNFGHNRTEALALAHGTAEWLLTTDADLQLEIHPGLKAWLAPDPVPEVDAWMIEIQDRGTSWRLPLLTRGTKQWRYLHPVHSCLDVHGRTMRPLRGLVAKHLRAGGGGNDPQRFEQAVELLADEAAHDQPRAVFYTAESLRFLGRKEQAIAMYDRRATLGGWDEEVWYSHYQAAKLREDVDALLEAHKLRPWRPEPLRAAARIVTNAGARNDTLFLEST